MSVLPHPAAGWITALVGTTAAPAEPRATCTDCAMCVKAGALPLASTPFRPDTKCCQGLPELANWLVGSALCGDERARASIRARLAAGAVSPLGMGATSADEARWRAGDEAFGQRPDLICPHFEDGACAIWAHRNGVCATWFCRHERGAAGYGAWLALQEALRAIESTLAVWALGEIGVDPILLRRWLGSPGERPPFPALADRAAWWGSWAGREEELFVGCWERVRALGADDVLRIGGPDFGIRIQHARAIVARRDAESMPARLGLGSWRTLAIGEEATLVSTYSLHDGIQLPAPLFSVLHLVDGRPTEEVFGAMAEERGISLDPGLVRRLLDWQVLVPR